MRGHWTMLTIGSVLGVGAVSAQVPCGQAVVQLQQYVAQVNQVATFEYYQGIPARCFGNGFCAQAQLQQLGMWYRQQAGLVNQWYGRITATCTPGGVAQRLPTDPRELSAEDQLDESSIDDIQVDDEDRTVRIKIPRTASGFRPR